MGEGEVNTEPPHSFSSTKDSIYPVLSTVKTKSLSPQGVQSTQECRSHTVNPAEVTADTRDTNKLLNITSLCLIISDNKINFKDHVCYYICGVLKFFHISAHPSNECVSRVQVTYAVTFLTATSAGLGAVLETCTQDCEGTEKYRPLEGIRKSFLKMTTEQSLRRWL